MTEEQREGGGGKGEVGGGGNGEGVYEDDGEEQEASGFRQHVERVTHRDLRRKRRGGGEGSVDMWRRVSERKSEVRGEICQKGRVSDV